MFKKSNSLPDPLQSKRSFFEYSLQEAHDRQGSEHEQTEYEPPKKKSSPSTVTFNIINTAIGGGILGYPYIIRQLGIFAGVTFIILGALLTVFSTSILQKLKNISHQDSYIDIAQACFKRKGKNLCSVIMVLNTLGVCVIYLVVFATVVQNILQAFVQPCSPDNGESEALYCKPVVLIPLGGLIVLPFNFMKNIDKLKFVSILKVLAIVIFTGITIIFSIGKMTSGESSSDISFWPNIEESVPTIACIPSIFFGYNFLYNQFPLYRSLKDATDKKFSKIMKASLVFITFTYLCVGLFGYLNYGSATDNMLINFSQQDLGSTWFSILNISFLICSLGGIPVTYFPAKNIIYEVITEKIEKNSDEEALNEGSVKGCNKDRMIYICVVLVTNFLIIVTAIVAPGLNQVLGLLGSIGSASLLFLFPMAFYLKLAHKEGLRKAVPVGLIVFGSVLGIAGLATNFLMIL